MVIRSILSQAVQSDDETTVLLLSTRSWSMREHSSHYSWNAPTLLAVVRDVPYEHNRPALSLQSDCSSKLVLCEVFSRLLFFHSFIQ